MTLVIAGERSGVGKTTVTIALLAYLIRRGLNVQSFKVGPDYIDPMFHTFVTGRPCRNLDPVLTSESYVKKCFSRHIQDVDCALVEGVMGLFDGVSQKKEEGRRKKEEGRGNKEEGIRKREEEQNYSISFASTAHVAYLLNLPVLFVIDCSRLSGSVAAIAHGFRSFNPNLNFAGLVLNRVASDRHLELLTDALKQLNLPILGVLRRDEAVSIPDRHLGLIPAQELPHLQGAIDKLADLAAVSFEWEQLLPLLAVTADGGGEGSEQLLSRYSLPHEIVSEKEDVVNSLERKFAVRIAVARDRAFNFYYQDNLDLLEELGAQLVFWSPLDDSVFPENVQGLYFGGGFPEVFAEELSNNILIRDAVRCAIFSGMPTYAECGGLMYLCDSIVDFDGNSWEGVGVLPAAAAMGKRLTLGYREAVAVEDGLMLAAGDAVWGHEFHRSHLTVEPTNPIYHSWRYGSRGEVEAVAEGWGVCRVHAAYLHLHWGARPDIPARFLQQCADA
ncbi:cobyrinate a,c-diamide synthase [Microcoleus sp. bin38.metabat.b11b12b14.051]|uniref:cobyrinate a,c-diamide synthase n=1 Tax=Microcoleus sp. bin38.metabat.b11b12b14.051 TaxID=2742709 RepID=UPI0025EFDBA8|nr:cobyrinate a,c-diamide synthase [Microcoleus sp. bin38.metabat.b11b12b14.051]